MMPWTNGKDKADIYYETAGRGPVILFVHPPGMGHVTFRRQKDELQKYFTVVTADLRGSGRSGMDRRQLTMYSVAEDMIGVLDELNIQEAYVCGYSNGGSIVQEMAISFPERIKGMILLGSFPEVNSFVLKNEFRLGILATRMKMMRLISAALSGAHEQNKEKRKTLSKYVKRTAPEVLEKYYRIGLEYISTDRLGEIRCPSLLVYGEKADYLHHYRHYFTKYVSGPVDVVLVSSVSHQTPTKKGSALNQIVKNFIMEQESPGRVV